MQLQGLLNELGFRTSPQWCGNWAPIVSACIATMELVKPDEASADLVYFECDRRAAEAARAQSTAGLFVDQAGLWQDVFGQIDMATVDKFERLWVSVDVFKFAVVIYANEDFSRVPQLGKLLEDAGCDNDHIFAHCESEKQHVKECWLVVLILWHH